MTVEMLCFFPFWLNIDIVAGDAFIWYSESDQSWKESKTSVMLMVFFFLDILG